MDGYRSRSDWTLDEVSFRYADGLYRGKGLLTWSPEAGFHLEAFVERSGPSIGMIRLFEQRLATRHDWTSIRMRTKHGGRAFVAAQLTDRLDLLAQDRLSCDLGHAFFIHDLKMPVRPDCRWSGSALFKYRSRLLWPDTITRTTQLADETIRESFERGGLRHETSTLKVIGRASDDQELEVRWYMDRTSYRRADVWRWPSAFQQALSIELGCAVVLLEREVEVFPRQHSERAKQREVRQLEPFQPFEGDFVQKERLFGLTEFLLKPSREADACRKVFDQMVRASQQQRWSDIELVLSTTLEGLLRFLEGVRSEKKMDLPASLVRFRERYLSPEWRLACKRAVTAFEHLRHPTAHPDWILDKMDPRSESQRSQSFDDMRFLSRFFGYMILGLAGSKDLKPIFGGRLMSAV